MKKLFEYLLFVIAFCFGAAAVFVFSAYFFKVDVFGIFVTSATRVVGVFGDRFPVFSTRYGQVQIRSKSTPKGQVVEIGCASCRLEHRLIGTAPFTTASVILEGVLKKKHFDGQAKVEDVSLEIEATWEENNVSGSFDLPETEISKLFHAVRSIVPEAEKAKITGTVKGRGKFSWPEIYLFFKPDVKGFSVDGLVDAEAFKSGKFTYGAVDGNGKRIEIESGEGTPHWVPQAQLGKMLPSAVIAVEDRGFYTHAGFDIRSIVDATTFNKKSGRVRRGGSTLTQQLVKNLLLTDERTYSRKLRELLYSVEIDRELGKKRVLELYLNIVEWGPNIYGAKAAAQTYFGKAPADLLPEEAAWLANLLRAPKRGYEVQFKTRDPEMSYVENTLRHMSGLSQSERDEASARGLTFAAP